MVEEKDVVLFIQYVNQINKKLLHVIIQKENVVGQANLLKQLKNQNVFGKNMLVVNKEIVVIGQ